MTLLSSSSCCMNNKGMNLSASLLLLLMLVNAQEENIQVMGPDRIQEFHACVGTSAYIPWPINIVSRQVYKSTVIKLVFQRRHSEKKLLIATLYGQQDFRVDTYFKDRMSLSSENSGVFLKRVTMDDAGTFYAQAHLNNGQTWTRATNLTVHLWPIVVSGQLNLSKSEVVFHSSIMNNCVNLTCGTLEYAGYPPAKYVWTGQSKTLHMKIATDDSASSLQICAPYYGEVTCSIAGFSSVCTYDHMVSTTLDLSVPPSNATDAAKATVTQDLILTIVMPILAVLVPLAALGIWVLSHIFKSRPQYKEKDHYGSQEPQSRIGIEENGSAAPTHDDGDYSEGDNMQSEIKEDLYDSEEENTVIIIEAGMFENYLDQDNGVDEMDSRRTVGNSNSGVIGGHRGGGGGNEEEPLVDDTIGTVV